MATDAKQLALDIAAPVSPPCRERDGATIDVATAVAMMRKNTHDQEVAANETIGERIKRERLALGMTQRQLADEVGVGVPHISKVEAGRENPGDPLLRSLARVFKVDPDELFIAARRVPDALVERLAADPQSAVMYLRTFRSPGGKRK